MAFLSFPDKLKARPNYALDLDLSVVQSLGIRTVFDGYAGLYEDTNTSATAVPVVPVNGGYVGPTTNGIGICGGTTNDGARSPNYYTLINNATSISVYCLMFVTSTTGHPFGRWGGSYNPGGLVVAFDSNALAMVCAPNFNSSNWSAKRTEALSPGSISYGCTWAGGANAMTPYISGAQSHGSYWFTGTPANIQNLSNGYLFIRKHLDSNTGLAAGGSVSLFLIAPNRKWNDYEHRMLHECPWMVFRRAPQRKIYSFPSGAIRYGRPISDESVQWTPSTGSVNYALLADEDAGTYIYTTGSAVDVYRCTAMDTSQMTNPQISFEVPSGFTPSGTVTVQLWQGNPSSGTKIAEKVVVDPTAGQTYTADVTGTITDGSDLWWRVVSS